jgi:PAS domain S-box-containing protein
MGLQLMSISLTYEELKKRVADLEKKVLRREQSKAKTTNHENELEQQLAWCTSDLRETIELLKSELKERERIENQLRHSDNTFRSIINSSPMGIHMYDLADDGRMIFTGANPAADRILNIDHSQFIGKTIEEAFPASTGTAIPAIYRRVCSEGQAWHSEEIPYEDGRIKGWFEVHAFQIRPGAMAAKFRDISARKAADQLLTTEKEKFRILTELSPLGVSLIDREGRYKYVNPKFVELFGYSTDEISTGRDWFRRAFPESDCRRQVIKDWIHDLKEAQVGEVRPRTYQVRCRDGSDKTIRFRPVTMKGGDQFVIYEDITERKRLEAHLQQAQKMEAIGTLAGGIAHDFNNILAAILGYGELLAFDMTKDTPAWHNLQAVLKSCHRAKDLVGQILAFSRQNELNLMPVRISTIVKEALKMLRASLPATIEIRRNIEASDGIVNANATQIHQVLMNLCTNAGHAMRKKGGVLGVTLSRLHAEDPERLTHPDLMPGTYLKLSVSDTGHGMTAGQLQRIFDPYFTTKQAGEGTGLGLAVVQGIVRAHGGAVKVGSTPEKGSVFDVYLPEMQKKIDPKTDAIQPYRTGHETVLFVDDEPALVTMSKQMLELLGYRAVARTSSIEAYELFRHDPGRFDLVITDMTMPNLTGEKLAGKMLAIRPDIPIILCTGYSEQITEKRARDLGIQAFVMKPLVMRDLADTIREVLDKAF